MGCSFVVASGLFDRTPQPAAAAASGPADARAALPSPFQPAAGGGWPDGAGRPDGALQGGLGDGALGGWDPLHAPKVCGLGARDACRRPRA